MKLKLIIALLIAVGISGLLGCSKFDGLAEAMQRHEDAMVRNAIALTVNRVMHEQINGTWPKSYGSNTTEAKQWETEIINGLSQNITDWNAYKP